MKRISILLLVFSFSCLCSLSLEEAKELALENNLELSSSCYEQKKAKKQYWQAWGDALLQVNAVAGYSYKKSEYPDASPAYIDRLTSFAASSGEMTGDDKILAAEIMNLQEDNYPNEELTNFAYGIEATQIISLKTPIGVSMVGDVADISSLSADLKRQEVLFTVSKYYYMLLLASQEYQIQKQALEIAQENFEQVESMYRNGVVSQYDYLRARLEVTKQKPKLEQSDKNLVLARQSFKNYVRWDDEQELVITDSLKVPSIKVSSLDESLKRAQTSRKELEIAKIATTIKRKDYRVQQISFLPDFKASFEYKQFSQTYENSVETDNFGNYWQMSLGASMPLFTSFARFNKVSVKQYAWRQAREDELNTKDLVKLDVQNSYYTLIQSQKSWQSQKENQDLAKKAFSIAQGRYENGISTQLEFLDATLQQNVAELGYLNSVYEYIIALQSYKMAIGDKL